MITDRSDGTVAPPAEEITSLLDRHSSEAVDQIDQLLGRTPAGFDHGRVALLVCPVCGGPDCGSLTAELIIDGATAQWRDLGWQTTLEDGFTPFTPAQCFTFDRQQYVELLSFLRGRFDRG